MNRLHVELTHTNTCLEDWERMSGTPIVKHCESCNKSVHNIGRLTPSEIEELVHSHSGHFCARVTRTPCSEIVTALPSKSTHVVANFVLLTTLSGSLAAVAQNLPSTADVNGPVLLAKSTLPATNAEILFIQNGNTIQSARTGVQGTWQASLAPGKYDVIFRTGALFGERVNSVDIHAGNQSFAPVTARFAYGHLQPEDGPQEETVFVGEVVSTITGMSFHYAVSHPLAYLGMIRRHLTHAFS